MAQNKGFLNFFQFFLDLVLNKSLCFYLFCFHKYQIWENFGLWIMSQNMLSQSDCTIFKSAIWQKKLMNKLHFWQTDIDSRSIKDGLLFFSLVCSKLLLANQTAGFLNQLYLKSTWSSHVHCYLYFSERIGHM